MKKILFRSDSSSQIGHGHIMRDLVLAKGLQKNYEVMFAAQNLMGNINNKIVSNNLFLHTLASNSLNELIEVIQKYQIDIIIFDCYSIDYYFEKEIKNKTGVQVVSMDDDYQKHYCDIVLNHNPGAKSNKYEALTPNDCLKLCGIRYTLIRNEFRDIRHKPGINRRRNTRELNVLVMMGGSDPKNITHKIACELSKNKQYALHLITTSSNENIKLLQRLANKNKNIILHVNAQNVSLLMQESDIAIISPSVTAAEALYMRLPFIAVKTAENQHEIYKYLKQKRLHVIEFYQKNRLEIAIKKCIKNYDNTVRRLKAFYFFENTLEYIV